MESLRPEREIGEIERVGQKIRIRRTGSSEVVGELDWKEDVDPVPHLNLRDLKVSLGNQGRGFASQLMDAFELLCREKGLPGMVYDAIDEDTHPLAVGMYGKRNGWVPIPQSDDFGRYRGFAYNIQPGQTAHDFWND